MTATPYTPKAETTWRLDPVVEAARKLGGWQQFHRECAIRGVYYDHIERESRRGAYLATAFTGQMRRGYFETTKLADGRGATPVQAIADAFGKCGVAVPAAEPWLAMMLTPTQATPVSAVPDDGDDFDSLIDDDFEGLL